MPLPRQIRCFPLRTLCLVLFGGFSGTHARQAAPHWTGSGVPATGHGVALEPLRPKEAGPQAEFLGLAQITQWVPFGGVLPTHQQRKGKTALAPALALGRREKREREPNFRKLSFFPLLFSLPGRARWRSWELPPGSIFRGTPRTRDTALVCFSVSCTHKLELAQQCNSLAPSSPGVEPLDRLEHEHVLLTFAMPIAGLAHPRADLAHARSRSGARSRYHSAPCSCLRLGDGSTPKGKGKGQTNKGITKVYKN